MVTPLTLQLALLSHSQQERVNLPLSATPLAVNRTLRTRILNMDELPQCSGVRSDAFEGSIGLRVGGIFILLVSSGFATLFPVVTRRIPRCALPMWVFDGLRYFGGGIIIATAFIHLLGPSVEELGSPCLSAAFRNYPWALALAMASML